MFLSWEVPRSRAALRIGYVLCGYLSSDCLALLLSFLLLSSPLLSPLRCCFIPQTRLNRLSDTLGNEQSQLFFFKGEDAGFGGVAFNMGSLTKIALVIGGVSFMTFVTFFGRLPALR